MPGRARGRSVSIWKRRLAAIREFEAKTNRRLGAMESKIDDDLAAMKTKIDNLTDMLQKLLDKE